VLLCQNHNNNKNNSVLQLFIIHKSECISSLLGVNSKPTKCVLEEQRSGCKVKVEPRTRVRAQLLGQRVCSRLHGSQHPVVGVTDLFTCWHVPLAQLPHITLKLFYLNTALFTVPGHLVKTCKQQHKSGHMSP